MAEESSLGSGFTKGKWYHARATAQLGKSSG